MGTITINGKSYTGNNIKVTNNVVFIDGKQVDVEESKTINIKVEGNVNELHVDTCNLITIDGNVNTLSTVSGDVNVSADIKNNVSTVSGDVSCYNIAGNVKTVSGDVYRS